MSDFQVKGADQIARAARTLRAADKTQRREFYRAIQRGTKEVHADMQSAARTDLPQRGGLAAAVAASRFSTRTRTGPNTAGVRIVVAGKKVRDVRSINRGRVRHPVHPTGPRSTWTWVNQAIEPGVFDRPFLAAAPQVRRDLIEAMETVVKDIARGSR